MKEKTELINYSKDNNDNLESNFAYYFTQEYIIWIFCKKNNEIENKKIFEKIFNILIEKYINLNKYSLKSLKILNDELKREIEYIKEELSLKEDISLSLSIIISDYNSVIFSYFGDIFLSIIRDQKIIFQSYTNDLNDINMINQPFYLQKDDILVINSKNILNDIDLIDLKDIEFKESYLLFKICFKEININSSYINLESRNKKIFFISIILIIFSYIFLNNWIINARFKKISNLENEFELNSKKNDLFLLHKNINEQIKILNSLSKKYIYLNKGKLLKKIAKLNEKEKMKKELDDLKIYLENIEFLNQDIYMRNFDTALKDYLEIKIKVDSFDNKYIFYKQKINKNVESLNKLIEVKNKENSLDFQNIDILNLSKDLNEIIFSYNNSNFKIYIDDLLEKKEKIDIKVKELENTINDRILNIDIIKLENLTKAKKECEEILEILKNLNNQNLVVEFEGKIKDIEKEITYQSDELNISFKNALSELEDKNYKLALSFFENAKSSASLLGDKEKLQEINGRIRYIKKNLNKSKTPKLDKEILKSIMFNIKQGDEYLKNNQFEKAYKEYKRALEMAKEIKIDNKILLNTNKKIDFIKNKVSKKWWELWK